MNELDQLFQYLEDGYRRIDGLGKQNHLLLTLGVTGAGKSTFILHVAGYDHLLNSKELGAGTGEFVIEDDDGKISSDESTLCSQTFFPELVKDSDSNLVYCDCPGFEDTRRAIVDMANAYFIHKVIGSSVAVKLAFVVSYSSVRVGVNRTDFKTLIEHATALIKDINKMEDSICLVVTKVDNTYLRDGTLVSDETTIMKIVDFLEKAINSARQMSEQGQWDNESSLRFQQFLRIFLHKDERGNYPKICLFRRPDESGRLTDIPLLSQRRETIKYTLNEKTYFQNCTPNDFGFSIKHESQNQMYQFLDLIQDKLISLMKEASIIHKRAQRQFILESFDIPEIINYNDSCEQMFLRVLSEFSTEIIPLQFIKKIERTFTQLDLVTGPELFKSFYKIVDYFDTLAPLSKEKVKYRTMEWEKTVQDIVADYRDSRSLYTFFSTLLMLLLDYDVQSELHRLHESQVESWVSSAQTTPQSVTSLMQLLKPFVSSLCGPLSDVKDVLLSDADVSVVKEIIDLACFNKTKVTRERGHVIIMGGIVKLSDVSEHFVGKVGAIYILAQTKVFIDIDLDLEGRNAVVVIISPIWEVVGARKIILDGSQGKKLKKAKDGEGCGSAGEDGMPGLPGGCGGHFYGIVDQLFNGNSLMISSNGGDGGPGQDGGDGAPGSDGQSGSSSSSSETVGRDTLDLVVWTSISNRKAFAGEKGGPGGDGGNGGVGGLGGQPGRIEIRKMESGLNIVTVGVRGKEGIGGIGGRGAQGGKDGSEMRNSRKTYKLFQFEISTGDAEDWEYRDSHSYGAHGENGLNGYNEEGRKRPEGVPQVDSEEVIHMFLEFTQEKPCPKIRKSAMERFINFINV